MKKSIVLILVTALLALVTMGCNNTIIPEIETKSVEIDGDAIAKGTPNVYVEWSVIDGVRAKNVTQAIGNSLFMIGEDGKSIYVKPHTGDVVKLYESPSVKFESMKFAYMGGYIVFFMFAENGSVYKADVDFSMYFKNFRILNVSLARDKNGNPLPLCKDFVFQGDGETGQRWFYFLSKDGKTVYHVYLGDQYKLSVSVYKTTGSQLIDIAMHNGLVVLSSTGDVFKIIQGRRYKYLSKQFSIPGATELAANGDRELFYIKNGVLNRYHASYPTVTHGQTNLRSLSVDFENSFYAIGSNGAVYQGEPKVLKIHASGKTPVNLFYGDYDLDDLAAYGYDNDSIYKIWVSDIYKVRLFEHHHFLGSSNVFYGYNWGGGTSYTLSEYGWDKRASSLKVYGRYE